MHRGEKKTASRKLLTEGVEYTKWKIKLEQRDKYNGGISEGAKNVGKNKRAKKYLLSSVPR